MKRYFLATNDVESTSIRYNKQRDITAEKVLKDGMPILLDIYSKLNIKSTFFFTGEIAEKHPDIVKMILPGGHEVASHGYSHEENSAFDKLGYHEQVANLIRTKNILEDITGIKVRSFRAPALRVNEFTTKALESTGFDIDSSISSQRADSFFSRGALRKLNRLFAPRFPYFVSAYNMAQKGNSTILEIPISAMLIPYIGTTMRTNPVLIKTIRSFLNRETCLTGKPVNFLIHPNELFEECDEDNVEKRYNNPISDFFDKNIRLRLKNKNLGLKAIELFQEQLDYFIRLDYTFCTLSQYKDENYK